MEAPTSNAPPTQKDALDLLNRSGGAYMPPSKLKALQDQVTDKSSEAYQRITWEALKKSINGLINKANTSNLKNIIPELIHENLVRGRGLFCRSIMKSQHAALPFTPVYAATVAVLNTKFPQLGEMLTARLLAQFRRGYRRNLKPACLSSLTFLAHLANQHVVHELAVLQLLTLLLERPTDDAVELAVALLREAGAALAQRQPRAVHAVFDRLRAILHEASALALRTQYMVEVLFQLRKDQFRTHPAIPAGLDLVDADEQITHVLSLDEPTLPVQEDCNVFTFDPMYLENEAKYTQIKNEILGGGDEEDEDASDADGEEDEEEEEEDEDGEEDDDDEEQEEEENDEDSPHTKRRRMNDMEGRAPGDGAPPLAAGSLHVIDETQRDVLSLRKTIYLTLMSSLDFEECCHKLLKIQLHPSQTCEVCNMIVECCSQERTYMKFYGLMAERFCKLNRIWTEEFARAFESYYTTIHRYETGRLRNMAKLFAHLLASDALAWPVLRAVRLTEETTTSASRIFVKILFQELQTHLGLPALLQRLHDPFLREHFADMFPKDHPRNTRFAINYWTSIGLGAATDELREWLKTDTQTFARPKTGVVREY